MARPQPARRPLVYAVVVTLNEMETLKVSIPSLLGQDYPRLKIVIVDNGHDEAITRRIADAYPQAEVISSGANLGSAGGLNLGIVHALQKGADYVCLFNDDERIDRRFASEMVKAGEENPRLGVLAGKVYRFGTKVLQLAGGGWFSNEQVYGGNLLGAGETDRGQYDGKIVEMDYVIEGATAFKRKVFEKIGLFDPGYFVTMEGPDFCTRAAKAGFGVAFVPEAKVEHMESVTTDRKKNRRMGTRLFLKLWLNIAKNGMRFLIKHRSPQTVVRAAVKSLEDSLSKAFSHPHLPALTAFAIGWNAINLPSTLAMRNLVRENHEAIYEDILLRRPPLRPLAANAARKVGHARKRR